MFLKSETQKDAKGLSDLIDYSALVADGVVLTSTGLYVAGWEFLGLDMDALPVEESWQIANRLASKFRLGSGWTVQCDLIRGEHQEYCRETVNWPDPVSYLIEQERRSRFLLTGEAAPRLSRYFLALSYEPALKGAKRAARWVFSSAKDGREGPGERALALSRNASARLIHFSEANCAACAGCSQRNTEGRSTTTSCVMPVDA